MGERCLDAANETEALDAAHVGGDLLSGYWSLRCMGRPRLPSSAKRSVPLAAEGAQVRCYRWRLTGLPRGKMKRMLTSRVPPIGDVSATRIITR